MALITYHKPAPTEPPDQNSPIPRGKLTIFLGACAGVGKTYAMLEAAQAHRKDGIDDMAGIVETYGRPETDALLEGFEWIDPFPISYRKLKFKELNAAAVKVSKPAILLVNEIARTNAPARRTSSAGKMWKKY